MNSNYLILAAIVCLTIIMISAMAYGVNGTLRTFICMAIAGLAGWRIPIKKDIVEVKL